ncbi:uncharacterized protein ColSpa_04337 [Colletotrichum spaethianum]|uniref:DNA-binding protein RAP1 n=1 Tax=Colletotrichum spaethianum TaxID=700344 RepID=A0AA37L8T0_9PEZI|nr:uncharacterized protein ColSpa_04337 [Colletotrichum spaethianum]GKT44156.1 hypothetical protein ColSpa_04337 [Colletotrichum spaethianum]
MSAAITYNGVPGAQGTLFKEISFFVAQRVPDRKTILDLITQNGGKIVKLDKQADKVIADHARADCPPGSLHWGFVKDSVDNGAVQETDKYMISQSPMASRPVGSSRPPALSAPLKGTRTPFNAADDALLARWVLSHPPNKRSGNEVYKTLEEMSWRDRWVKKVSKLPQAALDTLVASAPEIQISVPSQTPTSSRRPEIAQVGRRRSPAPVAPAAARLPSAGTPRVIADTQEVEIKPEMTSPKRVNFTKAEDDILLQAAREHGPPFTTRFFQDFAEKNPSHSWTAWRKHWADNLKSKLNENLEDENPLPKQPPANNIKPRPDTARSGQPNQQKASTGQPDTRPVIRNLEPAASLVSRTTAENDGHKQQPEPQGDGEASQGVSREVFFDHLKTFREYKDLGTEINPEINGQPVDIWLLWQAVRDQYQKGGVETDWEAAAKALGLHNEAAQPLQQYYTEYVAEFAASGFLDEPDAESEDDEASQSGEYEVDLGMPAKPQKTRLDTTPSTSKKRLAITVETSGTPSTPNGRKKRQRFSADDEIPSTPDERLGIASFGNLGPSPSLSAGRVPRGIHDDEDVGMDGEVERSPSRRARRFEPETQDFAFEDAPRQESQSSAEFDISPSQQLLGEVEAVTPMPLSFEDKGKGVERIPAASPVPASEFPAAEVGEDPEERTERAIPDSQESADKTVELEDLIDRFDTFGYAREDIVTALNATSLCTPLATDLLKYLRKHKELPNNWQGVWTANDDKRLRRIDDANPEAGPDRARLQKYWGYLVKKHTQERIERRREFLAYLDEVAQSSQ